MDRIRQALERQKREQLEVLTRSSIHQLAPDATYDSSSHNGPFVIDLEDGSDRLTFTPPVFVWNDAFCIAQYKYTFRQLVISLMVGIMHLYLCHLFFISIVKLRDTDVQHSFSKRVYEGLNRLWVRMRVPQTPSRETWRRPRDQQTRRITSLTVAPYKSVAGGSKSCPSRSSSSLLCPS